MRIKRKEKIGNIPIIKIRDYFKCLRRIGISKDELRNYFELSSKDVTFLITELLERDFIEKAEKQGNREYQLTIKGQALCTARCVSPMNKEKADKIFKDFMQRVEEINKNDYYLFKIEKLFLFGSYLSDDNIDFGDIDIAFELKRKIEDAIEFEKADDLHIQKAIENGKKFSNIVDKIFYSETEVLSKLKNKCKYISLHPITDEILEIAKYKQIYPLQ